MKRSEMVKLMETAFWEAGRNPDTQKINAVMDKILEAQENAGMLPPHTLIGGGEEPNQAVFSPEWEEER